MKKQSLALHSISQLENSNTLLFFIFLAFAIIHYFIFVNEYKAPQTAINYSQNISNQIAVQVQLSQIQKKTKPKPLTKKPAILKKEIKEKKTEDKLSQETSNKEVKQSAGSATVLASYLAHIRELVNKYKTYPRIAKRLKHKGRVKVEIIINSNGEVVSTKLIEKTFSTFLNNATIKIFNKLTNVGAIPQEIQERPLKITIPVVYDIL